MTVPLPQAPVTRGRKNVQREESDLDSESEEEDEDASESGRRRPDTVTPHRSSGTLLSMSTGATTNSSGSSGAGTASASSMTSKTSSAGQSVAAVPQPQGGESLALGQRNICLAAVFHERGGAPHFACPIEDVLMTPSQGKDLNRRLSCCEEPQNTDDEDNDDAQDYTAEHPFVPKGKRVKTDNQSGVMLHLT